MIWNDRLRQLREQSGYTLKEIAGKLGVSEAMVSRHESSTKNIPNSSLKSMREFTDVLLRISLGGIMQR